MIKPSAWSEAYLVLEKRINPDGRDQLHEAVVSAMTRLRGAEVSFSHAKVAIWRAFGWRLRDRYRREQSKRRGLHRLFSRMPSWLVSP